MVFSLIITAPAYADGGGPILLLISFYLFVAGQVWIILSEFIYMRLLHREEPCRSTLKTVVLMNLVSMILGGLTLPFLLALIGLAGAFMHGTKLEILGSYIFALGTWVAGDNSPHATLAVASAGVGFVGTYFITVYVERWYLARRTSKGIYPSTNLRHCYCLNAISYAGLILLMGISGNI